MPATAPTNSRCGLPARPTRRWRRPAAASSRRSRRCGRRARTISCAQSLPRLDALIAEGVTTIEIKSGYGLDLENEAKSLKAARRLGEERPVTVRTSFLGAHALPPEAEGDKDAYIDLVANEMLPAIAAEGLADAVDGFCEGIAFSPDQMSRVFEGRQGARPAGKTPCRPAFQPRRRSACRKFRRAVGRSSRIHRQGRRDRHGQGRNRRGDPARRLSISSARRRSRRSIFSAATA